MDDGKINFLKIPAEYNYMQYEEVFIINYSYNSLVLRYKSSCCKSYGFSY
jgi:hypothetical protein